MYLLVGPACQAEPFDPLCDLEMFSTLEQSCSWSVRWYQILSSRRPLGDFQPADVEVVSLDPDMPDEEVWNGRRQRPARRARRRQQLEHAPVDDEPGSDASGPDAAAAVEFAAIADGAASDSSKDYESIASGESDEAYGVSEGSDGASNGSLEDELDAAESDASDAAEGSESEGGSGQDDTAPPGAPDFATSDVWQEVAPPSVPDPPPPPAAAPAPVQGFAAGSGGAGAAGSGQARASAADARVCLPDGSTISFYQSTKSFEAVCGKHAEARCRLTRTCAPPKHASRKGQGRPLGFLASWCGAAHDLQVSADEHRQPLILLQAKDLALRKTARANLKQCQGYAALAAFERARADGEETEPECIP